MRGFVAWSVAFASLICISRPSWAYGQADTTGRLPSSGAAVVLGRDTLFYIRAGLGPFTPEQRATVAAERIRRVVRERLASFDSAVAVDNGRSTDVMVDSIVLFTVTDED